MSSTNVTQSFRFIILTVLHSIRNKNLNQSISDFVDIAFYFDLNAFFGGNDIFIWNVILFDSITIFIAGLFFSLSFPLRSRMNVERTAHTHIMRNCIFIIMYKLIILFNLR